MSYDPYGYEAENPERPPDGGNAGVVAGLSTAFWLGGAVLYCGVCSGLLAWQPPDDSPTWVDVAGVWHILQLPAWILAFIGFWTLGLHALARRWWTSVGPNLVVGAGTGCVLWFVVLIVWAALSVARGG